MAAGYAERVGRAAARVAHHDPVHIADFELERYFARWEFAVEHLLCASDVEGYPMADVLALADDEMHERWAGLRLGYTESAGEPLLRHEIASLYTTIEPDEVLVFAGAEEGIFCLMTTLLGADDHAVVTWPGYQSLYDVARANGAEVTLHELREVDGWAIDLDVLRRQVRPSTKVIVVNAPHNPTGMLPDRATWDGLVALAEESGAYLFADEVYRFLEADPTDRLPAGADVTTRGISLGVMSKSFALAGLRIGWVASHDRALLEQAVRMKDYTTICSSAPSEVLSTIALRARDRVIARSRAIVDANLVVLDRLFADRPDVLRWVRPRAGSVGFPRLLGDVPIDRFAADLVEAAGVLLLPGSRFGHPGNHFRIGFGRVDLPLAVARLEGYLDRVGAASGGATT